MSVFKSLSQKVLWKSDKDNVPGLPPNVKLTKWAPQQDLLGNFCPTVVHFIILINTHVSDGSAYIENHYDKEDAVVVFFSKIIFMDYNVLYCP